MAAPQNILEVWTLYQLHIETIHKPVKAKRILNESQSAVMRILLRGLGYEQQTTGRKMTQAEVNAAKAFMESLSIEKLIEGRTAADVGLDALSLSEASRKTYGGRLHQFLTWSEQQPWWGELWACTIVGMNQAQHSHCPPLRRGYGRSRNHRQTNRQPTYRRYQVQPEDITTDLENELSDFYHFLTAPERYDRWTGKISSSSANIYLDHIRLILGWFRLQGTPKKNCKPSRVTTRLGFHAHQ